MPAAEGGCVHPVVGLTSEVVGLRKELHPVFLARELAGREVVELRALAREALRVGIGPAIARTQHVADIFIAVFLDQPEQKLAVELVGIHALERRCAAAFPVLDEVTEQLAAPADTALEEREVELGEAPRDTAEEDRFRNGVPRRREMADVVVDEVAGRVAQTLSARAAVECGRHFTSTHFLHTGS